MADLRPRAHLLSSAVTPTPFAAPLRSSRIRSIVAGLVLSTGRNLYMLCAVIGAAAAAAGVFVLVQRHLSVEDGKSVRIVEVTTRGVVAAPKPDATPFPVIVEFSPEMLQVTAIALGHPRLAVINGRTVAEGETIVVHAPSHFVAITLRVIAIADGYVDLYDGSHVIRANFSPPPK